MGTPFLYFHVQAELGYVVKLAAPFSNGLVTDTAM